MFEELPRKLFTIKITGKGMSKVFEEIKNQIVESTIVDKKEKKRKFTGYIVGVKDEANLVVRSEAKLKEKGKYEIVFTAGRGIILINTTILERIDGIYPNIYVFAPPDEIFICERRRYYRIRPTEKADVIIKRENGYALSGSLGDISLGGFSINLQMKDKMLEYFLPLIDEKVKFLIDFSSSKIGKKLGKIDGTAILKHYTVDSKGFYRGGFSFSEINKAQLKKLLNLLSKTR